MQWNLCSPSGVITKGSERSEVILSSAVIRINFNDYYLSLEGTFIVSAFQHQSRWVSSDLCLWKLQSHDSHFFYLKISFRWLIVYDTKVNIPREFLAWYTKTVTEEPDWSTTHKMKQKSCALHMRHTGQRGKIWKTNSVISAGSYYAHVSEKIKYINWIFFLNRQEISWSSDRWKRWTWTTRGKRGLL